MTTIARTAQTPQGVQARRYLIGLWLFIASESMIFLALLAARFYLEATRVPAEANQLIALAITTILLLSSFTAYTAERAYAAGDRRLFTRATATTIGLGALFLAGVGLEWRDALDAFPPHTPFGTVFFTMTGMHAFHVLTGLVVLAIALRAGRASHDGAAWPVEAAVKYWHFVDVVWVFFYPALYLIH